MASYLKACQLHILTMEGRPLRTIPLPVAVQGANVSLIGTTTDEMIVVTRGDDFSSPRGPYWADPQDEITREEQVTVYHRRPENCQSAVWGLVSVVPTPVVLFGPSILAAALGPRSAVDPSFAASYAELVSQFWLAFGVPLLVSAGLACLPNRRQRALSGKAAITWTVFVFLLGPPGLVGYWAHRHRPVRQRCEHCGTVVPRNRSTCRACAAAFPPPALKGSEVFA